jgi:small-conductance mechanosensitive channel
MNETFELILPTANTLVESSSLASDIVFSVIIFFIGLILGRIAGKSLEKLFSIIDLDSLLYNRGVMFSVNKLFSSFVSYGIYALFFLLALNQLGITGTLLSILAVAIIVAVLITLFLSFKNDLPNLLAYRAVKKKSKIIIGEKISVDGVTGVVEEISSTDVKIKTPQEDLISIPHTLIKK